MRKDQNEARTRLESRGLTRVARVWGYQGHTFGSGNRAVGLGFGTLAANEAMFKAVTTLGAAVPTERVE